AVDLNPGNLLGANSSSAAGDTNGSQQVGSGYGATTGGINFPHALLWTGTATSAVDLNPGNLLGANSSSNANATNGSQQVGYGYGATTGGSNFSHALLWTGSAASAVDLHPANLLGANSSSGATDTNGSQQVGAGYGANTGGNKHALVWTGTA